MSAHALAAEAATLLADRTGVPSHDIALILGSGWGGAAEVIGDEVASVEASDVPGFTGHAVAGHHSTFRSLLTPTGKRVLVLGARQHIWQLAWRAAALH
ncbi:MAG: purine-nucleoside phosphorylase, partial [Demequina sp.]|nr:purine-nucleoside phosphorylase [Demequina sp.]